MGEIQLDRVTLRDTGEMRVTVRVRTAVDEPAPVGARIRLAARATSEQRDYPARVTGADGQWSIEATVPPGAPTDLGPGADLVDVFVDVCIGGDVVSQRLTWDEPDLRWLPYPTVSRKLSLTRVQA